jgi:hypothetical protein
VLDRKAQKVAELRRLKRAINASELSSNFGTLEIYLMRMQRDA